MSEIQRPLLVNWVDGQCELRVPGVVTLQLSEGKVRNLIRDLVNGYLRIDGSQWSGTQMSRNGKRKAG